MLLAIWLLATTEGVSSARQLARLCEEHDAYRWICGGVPINYHMLADFRVAQRAALDGLLSQIIASLMAAGAVTLERVAQDGMRVRASAGAASFRRRQTLNDCLREARAQVQRLAEEGGDEVQPRVQAARERAAREREARVAQALAYLPALDEKKEIQQRHYAKEKRAKVTEARSSTTDPEARIMKMADGGFRPAYNVQFATDGEHGVIVGVAVTNAGTDAAQAPPVVEQIRERTGACRTLSGRWAMQHATPSPHWRRRASPSTPPYGCRAINPRPSATSRDGVTVRRSLRGARGWRVPRRRPCTGNVERSRSGRTRKCFSTESDDSTCAAWRT